MRPESLVIAPTDDRGRLSEDVQRQIRRVLKSFAGKTVAIRLSEQTAARSLDQNAYWWAVPVAILAEHCGYTAEQMHYALLGEWGGYIDGPNGKPIPRIAASSKLTKQQFTELIDWVVMWASSELDVIIPLPDEVAA